MDKVLKSRSSATLGLKIREAIVNDGNLTLSRTCRRGSWFFAILTSL